MQVCKIWKSGRLSVICLSGLENTKGAKQNIEEASRGKTFSNLLCEWLSQVDLSKKNIKQVIVSRLEKIV